MKRIVSLLLCTYMLVTLLVPFTGSAAEADANDYRLTYDARIDRCPDHTNETDPLPAGVGIVETDAGLKMTSAIEYAAAVTVSVPKAENYTMKFRMTLACTSWSEQDRQILYYGFGVSDNVNDDNYYCAYDPNGYDKVWYNFDIYPEKREFNLINSWDGWKDDDSDKAKLAQWMVDGNAIEYSFHVKDGIFTGVSASAVIDGKEVTVTDHLDAKLQKKVTAFDKFGIATRVKAGGDNRTTITLESVSVEYNGKVQSIAPYTHYVGSQEYIHGDNNDLYNVRFVAGIGDYTQYEKLGFKVVARNASGEELRNIQLNCKYVYNSLTAVSGDGSVSEETAAKYNAGTLMALAIENIPMNLGEVHFLVTPTYTANGADGEGQTFEVVYNNGKLISQTAVAAD